MKRGRQAAGSAEAVIYLSRRERQILDAVYARGEATAEEIAAGIPRPPSQDAVRRLIRILEEKGHLRHRKDGLRHVYRPTVGRERARVRALRHVIRTFFQGSASQVVAALLGSGGGELSERELSELAALIEKARREGR